MICTACKRKQADRFIGDQFEIYNAPAEIALSCIASDSVELIATDPPYASGSNGLLGRSRSSHAKYRNTESAKLPELDRDAMLPEAWQAMMRGVWAECFRIAKDGADVLAFCDWRSLPMMMSTIAAAGFRSRSILVWDKGRRSRPQANGFRNQSEFILWFRKGTKAIDRDQPIYLDGVFRHATKTKKIHATEKPLALMSDLLQIAPPKSAVLDPFMGSGTTGIAAMDAGHSFIGCETSRDYFAMARRRLLEFAGTNADGAV
ncbi:MAG: site-specific DNA-methyltransferase [Planctomycetota bacterium]